VNNLDSPDGHPPKPINLSDAVGPDEWEELVRRDEEEEASSRQTPLAGLGIGPGNGLEGVTRTGLRQLMVLMERPFFALSKRRASVAEYVSPRGDLQIRVEPGAAGMATIYDADLVMFLVDKYAGVCSKDGRDLLLRPFEYFAAVGSKRGGDQYKSLRETIERLRTTRVTTNAQPDGKPGPIRTFSWLAEAAYERDGWRLRIAHWLAEGASTKFLLSVNPEYFNLSGYERFLYLAARKHVGRDPAKRFPFRITTLWKKSGSAAALARFRHDMKRLAGQNDLPDYCIEWNEGSGEAREAEVVFSMKSGRA
jgi:plasmid replication initiation protein